MTQTIQNPATAPTANPSPTGFQNIPTRISDLREATPPLVVESNENKDLICQSLGELSSRLADIHCTAAEAYMSQGSYDQALPHIEAAATFATGDNDCHMRLGFVRYITGDDTGAIQAFNVALAADPNSAEGWFNLGMVLFGQEQFAEAENCFGRSLAIEPGDSQTWNNRGVCLWRLDKQADAKACFGKALEIDPNDEDAIFNLQNLG